MTTKTQLELRANAGKWLIGIAATLGLLMVLSQLDHNYMPPVAEPVKPTVLHALGAFDDMLAETGCKSKYSDEKKADLFASRYKGRSMTVFGEVVGSKDGKVEIKVLRDTLTWDLRVELADRDVAYNIEKGQRVEATFIVSYHGGCFLSFMGSNGVLKPITR
jgi:hypothetical protein